MRKVRSVAPASRKDELLDGEPTPADVLRYLLHLPEDYATDSERTWPLVLFLHGAGERGADLGLAASEGLPKLADSGQEFPFVIVTPQCPEASQWVSRGDHARAAPR